MFEINLLTYKTSTRQSRLYFVNNTNSLSQTLSQKYRSAEYRTCASSKDRMNKYQPRTS